MDRLAMAAVRGHRRIRNLAMVRVGDSADVSVVDLAATSWSNCWFWALARWLKYGGGIYVETSEFVPVWRVLWCPQGRGGPTFHFHPTNPSRGLRGVWAAFWHRGRVRLMKRGE